MHRLLFIFKGEYFFIFIFNSNSNFVNALKVEIGRRPSSTK